jgi:hypothetical protein
MLKVFHTAYLRTRPFRLNASLYKVSTSCIFFVLSCISLRWPPFARSPLQTRAHTNKCIHTTYILMNSCITIKYRTIDYPAGHSGRAVWGVGLGQLVAGIVGSNPAQGMDVCPLCRQRPCDGLITRPRSPNICLNSSRNLLYVRQPGS